jgi:hypothetical protein
MVRVHSRLPNIKPRKSLIFNSLRGFLVSEVCCLNVNYLGECEKSVKKRIEGSLIFSSWISSSFLNPIFFARQLVKCKKPSELIARPKSRTTHLER